MDRKEELSTVKQLADPSATDLIGHNVPVHTSLPPQVEGHLRCFLCLCISQIKWVVHEHSARALVHVTWWGETGSGTIFRPFDGSRKENNNLKTTARYPIRSGPKQFKSYLNDMNVLLLEILDEDSLEIIGYAEVDHIATLTTYSPLKNTYMISSLADEKIAELYVSITLEPLMESYDSSGFVPTVDISNTQTFQTTKPDQLTEKISTTNSIKDSSAMNKSVPSSAYKFGKASPESQQNGTTQNDTTVSITTGGNVVLMQNGFEVKNKLEGCHPSSNINNSDLISILLEKGNKLRETMILSMADELPNKSKKQNLQNPETSVPIARSDSYGSLLREILNSEDCLDANEKSEDRVINLVLGPDHEELVLNNPDDSSVSSLELNKSDISDPLHEDDILQDLFYTNQLDMELLPGRQVRSHSLSPLTDPDNERLECRRRSPISSDCEDVNTEKPLKSLNQEKVKVSTKPKSYSHGQKSALAKSKTTAKSKLLSRPKSPSCRSRSPLHLIGSPRSKTTLKRETSPKIKKSPRSCTKRNKKLKKMKRKRNGSCTTSGSDASDTDSVSTCYSESSRVSFDMAPSDVEEENKENASNSGTIIDGLSIERLTLLGRATVARVAVDVLNLLGPIPGINPEKKSAASKPPKPRHLPQKSNSYFLEYQFPVVAAARDKYTPNTMATEVKRAVAKQVKENTVHFNHHSVFPLLFDGKSIENWWKSAINFKIYLRTSDQKSPSLMGCSQLPLKSILKAENLCLKRSLLVCKPGKQSGSFYSNNNGFSHLGHLKVSVDIGSDTAEFSSALSRTRIAELNGKSKILPIISLSSAKQNVQKEPPDKKEKTRPQDSADMSTNTAELLSIDSQEFIQTNQKIESKLSLPVYSDKFQSAGFQTVANVHQTPFHSYQNAEDLEPLALNSLLIISEGRKISAPQQNVLHAVQDPEILQGERQSNQRNVYIQCRMFWCDQSVSSSVCWGTNDPQFNFVQVSPVLITTSLLERMRNNYLVIEVWDRKTITRDDQLVGIVKLSLHQFYLSLKNKRITSALLKTQYPIIAHDCFVPIIDPLSNIQHGQLKVLLAIGSVEQVSTLQRVTLERNMSVTFEKEKDRNIDIIGSGKSSQNNFEEFVEHLFEIVIEDIKEMPEFEGVTCGETDCFVQYFFPFQQRSQSSEDKSRIGQQATLKSFRTATTLCVPDPSFQSVTRHKFLLYSAIPVQTKLLNAFVDNEGNVTELSFELWGRFYHPNVRDKVLAKATLPLVKMFAMVSMYKKEPLLQSFSLPLVSVDSALTSHIKNQNAGNLNLTITYKYQPKQSSSKLTKSQSSSSLYLSVGLLRICGLQAAAEYCASFNSSMQYPSEIGVNTYIKAKLSFIHDRICTSRTFARNFCPEVGQFFEFHCPLIDKDSCSLAEILESAELYLEFWHQVPADLESDFHSNTFEDVLLGVTHIPLIGLLTIKTGIQGWFPVHRPGATGTFLGKLNSHFTNQLESIMGGIEVKVNFTHSSDQERLLNAADTVGWNLPEKYFLAENFEDFEDGMSLKITINIDEVNIGKKNCFFPEQTVNSVSQCYLKYIFHDKGPFVSKPLPFRVKGKDFLFAKETHQNSFNLPLSASLIWYLKEEMFEVQLWCGCGSNLGHDFHQKTDRKRDRLIGSAWIPLGALCHGQKKNVHRISGIYPMFKTGLPNVHGMYIRAHISLQFQKVQDVEPTPEESSVLDSDWNDSFLAPDTNDFINIFHVHISIERAMHLTHITDKSTGKLCQPNAYVSFTTAYKNKTAFTNVIFDNDSPVWEYDLDTVLSSELLYQEKNKHIVFKVWHKPANTPKEPDKSSDQVIGFLSVDLAPLVSGLKQLCGWYNIIDFSGRCRGQVKLSITPLESIIHHWNQLKSHNFILKADKNVNLQGTLPHFSEHYQNVKLHHELLQNQQPNEKQEDYGRILKPPIKSTTKKVAFSSDSSSRSQLLSKLQQQMVELDELNAHLKTKLVPISLSVEREPNRTDLVSEEIRDSSSSSLREQNSIKKDDPGVKSITRSVLQKQIETPNVSEGLYTEQFFTGAVDKYLSNAFSDMSHKSCPVLSTEIRDEKHDEKQERSLRSGHIENTQSNYEEKDGLDHFFTAYPIGKVSSDAVPPPEWDDNYSNLTAEDPELVEIFNHQKDVENFAHPESWLEETQQNHFDNHFDKENQFQEFGAVSFTDFEKEQIYVSSDDDSDDKDEEEDDDDDFVIPRIMNDIPYMSDQPQTSILVTEERGNQLNPDDYSERNLMENITHNPTDKKPPDGLEMVPKSEVTLSDKSFDSMSESLEIPASYSEKIQSENDSPEIGKHIVFEEEFHLDQEPAVQNLHPKDVALEENAETTEDEMLSDSLSQFQEERLLPDTFAGHPLSKSDLDTNNSLQIDREAEADFRTKEVIQDKPPPTLTLFPPPPPRLTNQHQVNKIFNTNFFLPLAHLEESMKAVKISTAIQTYKSVMDSLPCEGQGTTSGKKQAKKVHKESKMPVKYSSLPTKEESQRIARIFSMKFS